MTSWRCCGDGGNYTGRWERYSKATLHPEQIVREGAGAIPTQTLLGTFGQDRRDQERCRQQNREKAKDQLILLDVRMTQI